MKSDYVMNLWQVYDLIEYSITDVLHGGCGLTNASWPLDGYKLFEHDFQIYHIYQL